MAKSAATNNQQVPPPPRSGTVLDDSGLRFNTPWSGWFRQLYQLLNHTNGSVQTIQQSLSLGKTATIKLASLTPLTATPPGTEGELVFNNGILTDYTAPT